MTDELMDILDELSTADLTRADVRYMAHKAIRLLELERKR